MTLYHVSRDITEVQQFNPRLPKYANSIEVKEPRICVADSIEGCIAATECWLGNLHGNTVIYDEFSEARVYEFDEGDINANNLLTPKILKNKKYVFDAEITGEHWIINQSIVPSKSYIIRLISAEQNRKDKYYTPKEIQMFRNLKLKCNNKYTELKISNLNYDVIEINDYLIELNKSIDSKIKQGDSEYLYTLIKWLTFQLTIRDNCHNQVTRIIQEKINKIKNEIKYL